MLIDDGTLATWRLVYVDALEPAGGSSAGSRLFQSQHQLSGADFGQRNPNYGVLYMPNGMTSYTYQFTDKACWLDIAFTSGPAAIANTVGTVGNFWFGQQPCIIYLTFPDGSNPTFAMYYSGKHVAYGFASYSIPINPTSSVTVTVQAPLGTLSTPTLSMQAWARDYILPPPGVSHLELSCDFALGANGSTSGWVQLTADTGPYWMSYARVMGTLGFLPGANNALTYQWANIRHQIGMGASGSEQAITPWVNGSFGSASLSGASYDSDRNQWSANRNWNEGRHHILAVPPHSRLVARARNGVAAPSALAPQAPSGTIWRLIMNGFCVVGNGEGE